MDLLYMVLDASMASGTRVRVKAPHRKAWKERMRNLGSEKATWQSATQEWVIVGVPLLTVMQWIREDIDPKFDYSTALQAAADWHVAEARRLRSAVRWVA